MNKEKLIELAKEKPSAALALCGGLLLFFGVTLKSGIAAGFIVLGIAGLLIAFFKLLIDL